MNVLPLETLILAVINGISIFLIIVVLANSFKENLYRWFVVMTILLMGWVDFAYLGYTESNLNLSILSYRLNLAFVAAFFFAAYVFYIESFLKIKKPILKWGLFTVSSIFVLLSLFTNTIIDSAIKREWGNEIHFGNIYPAFSIFAGLISIIFVYYFISRYITSSESEKRKIKLFLIGTILFIVFNVIFNILTTTFLNTAEYQHYGDYSAIIFLMFTAIAMVSRQFLNVKVALAAFVISAMSILLLIDIITIVPQEIKIIMLIFFVGLCTILMRSILNEIKQREELAKTNTELEESKAFIQRKAEEQENQLDIIGHEIKTPLSIIKQTINYIKETAAKRIDVWKAGKAEPKEVDDLFTDIFSIDELLVQGFAVLNDVLEAARIDKKRIELNISEFDLVDLARKSLEFMSKVDDAKRFELKFNDSELKAFNIKADETRIRQSIDALLTNALKYGVNIEGKQSIVELRLYKDNSKVYIALKDNGRGIDKEDVSKLGEKFVRLKPKTTNLTSPGGTGLGLYVVRNIMKLHGGDLLIESEGIGKGSTFTIVLPINLNKVPEDEISKTVIPIR